MVVRDACMACACGPTYFMTYKSAALHFARSIACNQSERGITTVVLPNKSGDMDAGGSGASGVWIGPPKNADRPLIVLSLALQVS